MSLIIPSSNNTAFENYLYLPYVVSAEFRNSLNLQKSGCSNFVPCVVKANHETEKVLLVVFGASYSTISQVIKLLSANYILNKKSNLILRLLRKPASCSWNPGLECCTSPGFPWSMHLFYPDWYDVFLSECRLLSIFCV